MKEYYFIFNIYNNLRFLTQKNMLYFLINRKKWENNKKKKKERICETNVIECEPRIWAWLKMIEFSKLVSQVKKFILLHAGLWFEDAMRFSYFPLHLLLHFNPLS